MRKSEVTASVKMILMARSAGICNFERCDINLVEKTVADGEIHLSEAAHIWPLSDEGPRGGNEAAKVPIKKRNEPENLLLLCPTHHTLIDKAPNSYPTTALRAMKAEAEGKIERLTTLATADVTLDELDAVCARFIADETVPDATPDLNKTAIEAKREKNGLSGATKLMLYAGLSIAARVKEYISHEAANDPTFPKRLVAGFRKHYYSQVHQGVSGDALFEHLVLVASGGVLAPGPRRSAGTAVLSYLFQLCEVFER